MAKVVDDFVIKIRALFDDTGLSKAAGSFTDFGNKVATGLNQTLEGLKKVNEKLSQMTTFIQEHTVVAFIDFDNAMVGARKTTGLMGADADILAAGLLKISDNTGIAAIGMAEIAEIGGQLGVAKDKILGFSEVISKMTIALDLSAGAAALAGAKISTAYDIPQTVEGITRIGDVINALSNATAASVVEVKNFALAFGGMSRTLGITLEQASAFGAVFASIGFDASDAATKISSALTFLTGAKLGQAAALLGVTEQAFRDLLDKDILAGLKVILDSLGMITSDTERLSVATSIFGRVGAKAILPLINLWDKYIEALAIANTAAGSMQTEFDIVMASIGRRILVLKNAFINFGIRVGEVMVRDVGPSFRILVIAIRMFLDDIIRTESSMDVFVLLAKSILIVGTALGLAVSMLTLFILGVFILGAFWAAITSPITAVIVVVGLLVLAFALLARFLGGSLFKVIKFLGQAFGIMFDFALGGFIQFAKGAERLIIFVANSIIENIGKGFAMVAKLGITVAEVLETWTLKTFLKQFPIIRSAIENLIGLIGILPGTEGIQAKLQSFIDISPELDRGDLRDEMRNAALFDKLRADIDRETAEDFGFRLRPGGVDDVINAFKSLQDSAAETFKPVTDAFGTVMDGLRKAPEKIRELIADAKKVAEEGKKFDKKLAAAEAVKRLETEKKRISTAMDAAISASGLSASIAGLGSTISKDEKSKKKRDADARRLIPGGRAAGGPDVFGGGERRFDALVINGKRLSGKALSDYLKSISTIYEFAGIREDPDRDLAKKFNEATDLYADKIKGDIERREKAKIELELVYRGQEPLIEVFVSVLKAYVSGLQECESQ